MSAIHDWLKSNRTFGIGVKLFEDHDDSAFYQQMFKNAGLTKYNKKIGGITLKLSGAKLGSSYSKSGTQYDSKKSSKHKKAHT